MTASIVMAKNNKRRKHLSCLSVLLIFCMLLVIALTAAVNLLFRNGAAPSFLGNHYCYYTEDDMPTRVPTGSLVIVEDTDQIAQKDIILYRNEESAYRIAVASLIVDTDSTVPDQTGKTYYLTTESNTTAVEIEEDRLVGICRTRSKELGALIGFLTSLAGKIVGLAVPLLIILICLISSVAKKKDSDIIPEDEDNDLAFVKSIQQKQQKIAERDAERIAKERRKTQTFDDSMYEESSAPYTPPQHRLTDEEAARMEEEEAARRAERIAAVRNHMEQRRQTDTPDGVPLYTTEIITKTHTLSIPRSNDKPLTTTAAQQRPLKPTPTEDIPRLTATGHIQIPTAEQLAAEQEDRLKQAQALARAAQDEAFGTPYRPKREKAAEESSAPAQRYAEPAQHYAEPAKHFAEPEPERPAVQTAPAPAPMPAPAVSAETAPVQDAAAVEKKTVKKVVKKVVKKQQIASSSFDDLMAFLDNEQKKL